MMQLSLYICTALVKFCARQKSCGCKVLVKLEVCRANFKITL